MSSWQAQLTEKAIRIIVRRPVLLCVGSTELLLDDSRRLHERIHAAGGSCELKVYADVPHCWQMLVPLVPEATQSLREATAFIDEAVARTA